MSTRGAWRQLPYDLRRPVNLPPNRFQRSVQLFTWVTLAATGAYFVFYHDFGPMENSFTPIRQALKIDKYEHPVPASMPMPNFTPRYEPVKSRDYHSKEWKRARAREEMESRAKEEESGSS
ncbi:hypothetical protein BT69DRAFT_1348817 [Atractiella rhizophila]|nr:hypothetical protein BT69DRAFT_1356948 [Atractiella rhizophila]KAH8917240.1 hypothetical protein BT69DRAFT_1354929 [Atractiella rhizophila]KAH8925283.1 hypothetical protein BT69DRAFT_1348817 [Atractiella rhizophila]